MFIVLGLRVSVFLRDFYVMFGCRLSLGVRGDFVFFCKYIISGGECE